MTKKEVSMEANRISMIFLAVLVLIPGAFGIELGISTGGGEGSESEVMDIDMAEGGTLNGEIVLDESSIIPQMRIIGPTNLFEETHAVTDSTGKKAQVSVKVVNALNGLSYNSLVLPREGSVSTQPWISAEQWLTVPKADSITCTASGSYGTSITSVSLDKATSADGYYSRAFVDGSTVKAEETGHVTGPFVGTAKVNTLTKTRTGNYGSEFDLDMKAEKGSAPTGTLGYFVNPSLEIQGAVDAAESGDAINVAEATYKENVKIDKSLTINGAGSGKTIIDGNKVGSVFTTGQANRNAYVTLNDMTIINGVANFGGGIYNYANLALADSTIYGNKATLGGGIYNSGSAAKLTVSDSRIAGNSANAGGGIINDGTATISGSMVNSNSAKFGGGIYNRGTATISSSTFAGDTAIEEGGAIENLGTIRVSDTKFDGNSAKFGAGMFTWGTAVVSGSTFNVNDATVSGGGIENVGTTAKTGMLTVSNTKFTGNTAWSPQGITVESQGGAISSSGNVKATITDSSFIGNEAEGGAGIYNWAAAGSGNLAVIDIKNCIFSKNYAIYGAGIASMESATATISDSTISDNRGKNGGGIINSFSGEMTLTNSIITGNVASGSGGGIYDSHYGILSVSGCTISGNEALYGGGIASDEGNGGTVIVSGSTITGNKANNRGGGISCGGTFTLTNSAVSGNSAYGNGGGIFSNGKLTVGGTSQVIDNKATTGLGGGVFSTNAAGSKLTLDGTQAAIKSNDAHLESSQANWYKGWGVYSVYGAPTTLNGFNSAAQVTGNTKI